MEQEQNARLKMQLDRYVEVKKRVEDKKKEMLGLQRRRDALLDVLVYIKGQTCPKSEEMEEEGAFPLILGKAHSKFSITSIGILPPEENMSFYGPGYIYPVGYKSKRRYNALQKSDPKVMYYCHIRNVNEECVFEIRSSKGQVWSGPRDKIWAEFSSGFEKISFMNIESFFGLTHEAVQLLIEEMGDTSVYIGYMPYKLRMRKGRKARKEGERGEAELENEQEQE